MSEQRGRRRRKGDWISGFCLTGTEKNGGHLRCLRYAKVPFARDPSGLIECKCPHHNDT